MALLFSQASSVALDLSMVLLAIVAMMTRLLVVPLAASALKREHRGQDR